MNDDEWKPLACRALMNTKSPAKFVTVITMIKGIVLDYFFKLCRLVRYEIVK